MKNTPHINPLNEIGFAKTVLMPGDPLRAEMIAKTFLENAVLVNNVRGMLGYTGYYKGDKISVMASGMGIPSMAIYSYELYSFFGVENIIRVGTAGGLSDEVKLRDIIAASEADTYSSYAKQFGVNGHKAPTCSYELLSKAEESAKELGLTMKTGKIFTSDVFYDPEENNNREQADAGALVVEMETAGLYINASRLKKNALAIFTVSDLPLKNGCTGCTAEERQTSFTDMVRIALETAIKT